MKSTKTIFIYPVIIFVIVCHFVNTMTVIIKVSFLLTFGTRKYSATCPVVYFKAIFDSILDLSTVKDREKLDNPILSGRRSWSLVVVAISGRRLETPMFSYYQQLIKKKIRAIV